MGLPGGTAGAVGVLGPAGLGRWGAGHSYGEASGRGGRGIWRGVWARAPQNGIRLVLHANVAWRHVVRREGLPSGCMGAGMEPVAGRPEHSSKFPHLHRHSRPRPAGKAAAAGTWARRAPLQRPLPSAPPRARCCPSPGGPPRSSPGPRRAPHHPAAPSDRARQLAGWGRGRGSRAQRTPARHGWANAPRRFSAGLRYFSCQTASMDLLLHGPSSEASAASACFCDRDVASPAGSRNSGTSGVLARQVLCDRGKKSTHTHLDATLF